MRLTSKVAVITGGSRGIGQAIAIAYARAGASVVITGRTSRDLEETVNLIQGEGGVVASVQADVRSEQQIEKILSLTLERFGQLDVLVNNVGGRSSLSPVMAMDLDTWTENVDGNLTTVFLCSKILGKAMVNQRSGAIINMASVAALGAWPNAAQYGASKAAVVNLTKSLAVELAPYNIRVNAIAPGMIVTERTKKMQSMNSKRRQEQLNSILLQRFGTPEDVAGVALFLASAISGYITGEVIAVTGGMTTTVFPP